MFRNLQRQCLGTEIGEGYAIRPCTKILQFLIQELMKMRFERQSNKKDKTKYLLQFIPIPNRQC